MTYAARPLLPPRELVEAALEIQISTKSPRTSIRHNESRSINFPRKYLIANRIAHPIAERLARQLVASRG